MYSLETIINVIDHFNSNNNLSIREYSKIINIPHTTISRWIIKYKNNISNLFNRYKYISFKKKDNRFINIEINKFVLNLIYVNPFITRIEVQQQILHNFNIKYNVNKITKLYKFLKLSFKKPKNHVIRNIEFLDKISNMRKQFIEDINKENINKVISIDECGFNCFNNKQKACSLIGTNVHVPIEQVKHKNQSLLMAITTNNILYHEIHNDSIDSDKFYTFIKNIIDKLKEKNFIFIFDNVAFHKNKNVLRLITSNNHKYIFTPPYSPNNNPIENTFSLIKKNYYKIIKNKIKNMNNIRNSINQSLDEFKLKYSNLTNFYNRAFKYDYIIEEKELRDRIIFRDKYKEKINKGIKVEKLTILNNIIDFESI